MSRPSHSMFELLSRLRLEERVPRDVHHFQPPTGRERVPTHASAPSHTHARGGGAFCFSLSLSLSVSVCDSLCLFLSISLLCLCLSHYISLSLARAVGGPCVHFH